MRLSGLVMGAALSFTPLHGCTPQASNTPDPTILEHGALNKNRDVWQLTWIADSFWVDTEYTADVRASVIDQVKIITWASDGKIRHSAKWLDCNMPKLELRRRVVSPAYTVEKKDGSGYETTPAELEPYFEVLINSEGCSFLPPASNQTYPEIIRSKLTALFKLSGRLRTDDQLTYSDSQGRPLAKFELQ